MIRHAHWSRCAIASLSWAAFAVSSKLQELPDYWKGLAANQTTPTEAVATSKVLALNTSLFDLFVPIWERKPANARS
jgi:hypothetical protein